jgi:broad specificity phosphatase PhoE
VFTRVTSELKKVVSKAQQKNETTLIVTHFFVARAIMALMETGDWRDMAKYSPRNLCMVSWDSEEILEKLNAL